MTRNLKFAACAVLGAVVLAALAFTIGALAGWVALGYRAVVA